MLTDTHPSFRSDTSLALALAAGKVAVTFRKVTNNRNRTIIASRSDAAIAAYGEPVRSDLHRPNPTLVEFLAGGGIRLRSFYPSEVLSWTQVSYDA